MMTELGQRVMLITLTFIQSYRTEQKGCHRFSVVDLLYLNTNSLAAGEVLVLQITCMSIFCI